MGCGNQPSGKFAHVGSLSTLLRPSVVTSFQLASKATNVGIPSTLNRSLSASFLPRCSKESAFHGISAKYSSNAFFSLSELTKTISILSFRPAVYFSANFGVHPRHGGHQ